MSLSLPRILVTAALGATALAGSSAALAQQKVDLAKSEITFVSKQMGVPVDGRFRKFDAQVSFDPKKPEAGKIAFAVDLGSTTVSPDADSELPKAVWFNVPKFPQATFQSGAIKAAGPGKFEVAGKLAIKGSSRDVVVPVTLTQAGGITTASGTFAIKRLDFKIGEGDWADTSMVANDVQVKFKLTLSGVGPL